MTELINAWIMTNDRIDKWLNNAEWLNKQINDSPIKILETYKKYKTQIP